MERPLLGVSQVLVDFFSSIRIIFLMSWHSFKLTLNWCWQYQIQSFLDPRQTNTEYQSPPVKQHSIERLNSSLSSGNPKNISIFDVRSDTKRYQEKQRNLLTALLIEREIFWFDDCRYSASGVPWQLPPTPPPSPGTSPQVPPASSQPQHHHQEGAQGDLPGHLQSPPEVSPVLQTQREPTSRWVSRL